jgi:hypothetical protein
VRQRADRIIIDGRPVPAPEGVSVRNYTEPGVLRFKGKDRSGGPVTEVIVHETVTRSVESTIRVLEERKLGVHLIVGQDGEVTQHGDLARDRLAHAAGHNGPSIGIEVVNPYYPRLTNSKLPWQLVIDSPWAHEGRYVVPTREQAEATAQLVRLLTGSGVEGLRIQRRWRGLLDSHLAMGRVPDGGVCAPGIWAHTYFDHADGAWLVLYAWLRLEAGLSADAAFEEAVRRATGVRSAVDLSDLITATASME